MHVRVLILALCCMFPPKELLPAIHTNNEKPDAPMEKALTDSALARFGIGELKKGMVFLDSLSRSGIRSPYALYLKGECQLLYGRKEVLTIIDSLRKLNMNEYADVLDLKTDLLLGDSGFSVKLAGMKNKYPGNYEVRLSEWLFRLDQGEYEWAKSAMAGLSEKIIFRYLPYQALYYTVMNSDYDLAKSAAESAMEKKFFRLKNIYRQQEVLHDISPSGYDIYEAELPYAECGPYFGIIMEDSSGRKIKVSLDTGTGGGLFSIHSKSLGEVITGGKAACIEKSIQYNYMSSVQDAFIKPASFRSPALKNFPLMYFEGSLTSSDGVFSPFAFKDLAVTVDPVNKKFTLRSKAALKEYMLHLKKEREEIKYRDRFGWIYIPCRVNGAEVMMMLETGSRDVNFNSLAAERYGIPVIKSTSVWKGREYTVRRPDISIQVGSITYKPKDGFVEDFVMGNHMYGAAGAGDIGPEFLRNYKFTIDPFGKKIILEK